MRYYKTGSYSFLTFSVLLPLSLLIVAAIPHGVANAQFVSSSRDPIVVGHVIDIPPYRAIGDSVGSGALISNINGTLQKAIFEYDITDIMPGVLESARITGQIGPQDSLPAGERIHNISTRAGDAVLSTADNDGTGSGGFLYQLKHEAGSQTPYDFPVTEGFRASVLENTGYLGQEISPRQSNEQGVDVASSAKLELVLRPTTVDTTVYYEPPLVGGEATATNFGDFSVDLSVTSLAVTDSRSSPFEKRRGILEYDISSIPPTAEILWAVLDVEVILLSRLGPTGPGTTIDIAGYQGDGVITGNDAKASTELLGTTPQITELGIHSWTLDPQYIETVVQSSDHLGLLLEPGDSRGLIASILLVEGRFSNGWNRPRLAIAYTAAVLKGDINLDGTIDFLDIAPFIAVLAVAGTQTEADCNCDGGVNFLDIAPFIAILASQ